MTYVLDSEGFDAHQAPPKSSAAMLTHSVNSGKEKEEEAIKNTLGGGKERGRNVNKQKGYEKHSFIYIISFTALFRIARP
jgi:hypothetical protein